nr:hypothetical protein GCM10020063_001130 [Dactylosporangium thailandense]
MKTLRVGSDGQGLPRLESLALPFLAQGPSATPADQERAPQPDMAAAVRRVRAVSGPAGTLEVVDGPSPRRLLVLVSGSLVVSVPEMRARLGAGDVLFLDAPEPLGAPARVMAETPCSYLDVEVEPEWLPVGTVPPALDEGRRSAWTAPRVLRMTSDGERAHLAPFNELFAEPPAPSQDVDALTFVSLSPSLRSGWHTEPAVSLVVVLAGGFELEVGGYGGRRTLRAGDVCLVEDFEGQGHKSSMDGETRFAALRLPRNHRWSRDPASGESPA